MPNKLSEKILQFHNLKFYKLHTNIVMKLNFKYVSSNVNGNFLYFYV